VQRYNISPPYAASVDSAPNHNIADIVIRERVNTASLDVTTPNHWRATVGELDAQALTLELGGRWHGRYGIARCIAPSHVGDDVHASMHIADGYNGRPVLICRSQHCQDIIEGLRACGLWPASAMPWSSYAPHRPRRLTLAERIALEPAPAPAPECCREWTTQCSHRKQFEFAFQLAHLRGELIAAAHEIGELYRTAGYALDAAELADELKLAIDFRNVGTADLSRDVIDRAVAAFAEEWGG
jgi:hypothetical protein